MSIDVVPANLRHLLGLPLFAHLATVRPDDTAQVNPMWFLFDGEHVKFSHTSRRGKFRNLQHNPSMAFSVLDPVNPHHYLEVRGRLVRVEPDPEAAFHIELGIHYGDPHPEAPADKADRVVLYMSVDSASGRG